MALSKEWAEIPLDKLVQATWNYKTTDEKKCSAMMEKLKSNLSLNGQIQNLIVREIKQKGMYEVVNGNHRLMALTELGRKTAVCFNLGKITQHHAERIAVETNETEFEADPIKLAGLLRGILGSFSIDELIKTMPMDQEEVENYTKLLDFDWDEFEKRFDDEDQGEGEGDGKTDDDEEWTTIDLRLPLELAEMFGDQIDRIKRMLYPKKKIEDVSIVPVVECITQLIAQTPDSEFL